jgi:hypothetical protein
VGLSNAGQIKQVNAGTGHALFENSGLGMPMDLSAGETLEE